MNCFNHQDTSAVGLCKTCNKGVCSDCANSMETGIYCKDEHEPDIDFGEATKKAFDHFRNFLIAASLIYIGLKALNNLDWLHLGKFGELVSYFVIGISAFLALTNSCFVIVWMYKNLNAMQMPTKSYKRGYWIKPAFIASYLVIVYVIINVALNLKMDT